MATKTTWVVVADGSRAHFYTTMGGALTAALDHDFAAPTRSSAQDVGSDRPGRAFDSAGQGRHAMEPPTDWKANEKKQLARTIADELWRAADRKAFDRLVMVAPPEMLGDMRDALDKSVSQKVVAEIAKDLTHLTVHQLPQHLGEVLRQ